MLDQSQGQCSSLGGQLPGYNALKCHQVWSDVLSEVLEKAQSIPHEIVVVPRRHIYNIPSKSSEIIIIGKKNLTSVTMDHI